MTETKTIRVSRVGWIITQTERARAALNVFSSVDELLSNYLTAYPPEIPPSERATIRHRPARKVVGMTEISQTAINDLLESDVAELVAGIRRERNVAACTEGLL
jgi:hypothetical protein